MYLIVANELIEHLKMTKPEIKPKEENYSLCSIVVTERIKEKDINKVHWASSIK